MKPLTLILLDNAMQDLDRFQNLGALPDGMPANTTQADLEDRLRQAEADYDAYCTEVRRSQVA